MAVTAPGILVTGSGRSGTSIVTLTLAEMEPALRLPADPVDPNEFNPTGYWEPQALHRFNEQHLAPRVNDGAWWDRLRRRAMLRQAGVAWTSAFADDGWWLWKSPDMVRLFPWWWHVYGLRPSAIVLVLRSVQASAASYRAMVEDPVPTDEWITFARGQWGMTLEVADRYGVSLVVLRYETLIDQPDEFAARVRERLGAATGLAFAGEPQSVVATHRHFH